VQEIVQCFAGLFLAPLPASIAAASRVGESLVVLGISARMLQALPHGETDPTALATLAAPRFRATPE
jgi:hypothetical protein